MLLKWLSASLSNRLRPRRRRTSAVNRLESLEVRCLLSAIHVGATSDGMNIDPTWNIDQVNTNRTPSEITFRDAIIAANNSAPGSTIDFSSLPAGQNVISVMSEL